MSKEQQQQDSQEKLEQQLSIEKEARIFGWVDKSEFRGDESDWTDAETFVKRGKEINPILRENNKRLLSELEKTKKEIQEVKQVAEEFKAYQKEVYERKLEQYKKEIDSLKQAKKEALQEGDHDLVVEIDDQILDAKAAMKLAEESPPEEKKKDNAKDVQPIDPELQLWLDRNSWFGRDQIVTQRTNTIGALIAQRNPNLRGKEFLEKLDEALAEEFPDMFKSSRRSKPNPVESGGSSTSSIRKSGKRTFENLPDEAKAAYHRFKKQGFKVTEDQYAADYQWE